MDPDPYSHFRLSHRPSRRHSKIIYLLSRQPLFFNLFFSHIESKIAVSISQRHGSADPEQNAMDKQPSVADPDQYDATK